MATYYHGNPEIQQTAAAAEGLQTLVLMNPSYVHYSTDTAPPPPPPHHHHQNPNNLLILNAAAANPLSSPPPPSPHHHHYQNQQQQFVGIPLDPNSHHHHHDLGLIPRLHYNLYNAAADLSPSARDTPRALSLSLSSQQHHHHAAAGYGSQFSAGEDNTRVVPGGSVSSNSAAAAGVAPAAATTGMQGVLLSSKYLKAAQDLLDQVVNVNADGNGNGTNGGNKHSEAASKKASNNNHNNSAGSKAAEPGESSAGDAATAPPELSTADRQEIQMKKAKLISMLDEVEQRYRQYHHQMQTVIAAFEQAAGIGSAKTYTALALQTISKQFRCLKDAITGQIKAASKSLGEEETVTAGGKIEGSRLKFVDHHLRQQRALQQLGMIQHNAWRPQRGLPERSVSILRAWLFEHFLHPYPKDSDKHMLAKQTGLTRSQVSNWFINARVRLWKPMVEEMYMEEMKDQELNGTAGEKATKTDHNNNNEDSSSKSVSFHETQIRSSFNNNSPNQHVPSGISISTGASTSPAATAGILRNQHSAFSLTASSELEGITQGSPKKPRNHHIDLLPLPSPTSVVSTMDVKPGHDSSDDHLIKFVDERQSRDHGGYSFMGAQTNFMGAAFGQYPIAEIERFNADQFTQRFSSGNGVSLSLGLPHCENLALPATHHTFLPNQSIPLGRRLDLGETNEFGAITTTAPHSSSMTFESINIQNRKGFAAQLLPDFVT
ncbi:unnamed protein product [Linum tenue]|uniref:Homeobox domain-containing protein n=1 Tax=Linum tenue TaxID=586396 RepID=A0AAV0I0G1_9ROSI|nr:unnamed protein product [Linum tenue]